MFSFGPWRAAVRKILQKVIGRNKETPSMKLEKALLGSVKVFGKLTPSGVTIHYSADREVTRTVASLVQSGLGYHYLIGRNGTIYQLSNDTDALAHAGKAEWRGKSPNRNHVSICIMSWGKLAQKNGKFYSWSGVELPIEEVRLRDNEYWDKATEEQEAALMDILEHYVKRGVLPEDICGHDECALPRGRKSDPGGVLLMDMALLRDLCQQFSGISA